MILCGGTTERTGERGVEGVGTTPLPPGRKIGGGRRRVDWVNKSSSLCNN